jgi:hypothetical protein
MAFFGGLEGFGNIFSSYGQGLGQAYQDAKELAMRQEAAKFQNALNVAQVAKMGMYTGPEGFDVMRGLDLIPSTQFQYPQTPVQNGEVIPEPQQMVPGLGTVPESYGKPTSMMPQEQGRSPAQSKQQVELFQSLSPVREAQAKVTAKKIGSQAEQAPDDQFKLARMRYQIATDLAKAYPQFVDTKTGTIHPYLFNMADEYMKDMIQATASTKGGLTAADLEILKASLRAPGTGGTGKSGGMSFAERKALLEMNQGYKSAQKKLEYLDDVETDDFKKDSYFEGKTWPKNDPSTPQDLAGKRVKPKEQSQYLQWQRSKLEDTIANIQQSVMSGVGQEPKKNTSPPTKDPKQMLMEKSVNTPKQADEKAGAPRKAKNGKVYYTTVTGELKELP